MTTDTSCRKLATETEYLIISHAGTVWTGTGWSRNDDDALRFTTRDAADTEQRRAAANEPRAYVVARTVPAVNS